MTDRGKMPMLGHTKACDVLEETLEPRDSSLIPASVSCRLCGVNRSLLSQVPVK